MSLPTTESEPHEDESVSCNYDNEDNTDHSGTIGNVNNDNSNESEDHYSKAMDEIMEAHFREMDDEIQRQLDEEIQDAIQKQLDEYLNAEREKLYAEYQEEMDRQLEKERLGDEASLVYNMQELLQLSQPRAFVGVKPTFADINAQIQGIVGTYQHSIKKL
jgi:cobalamin biosynthesis protein CobT